MKKSFLLMAVLSIVLLSSCGMNKSSTDDNASLNTGVSVNETTNVSTDENNVSESTTVTVDENIVKDTENTESNNEINTEEMEAKPNNASNVENNENVANSASDNNMTEVSNDKISEEDKSKLIALSVSGADIIMFYGEGCSHCETVKKFAIKNNVFEKIKIDLKEVYNDINNSKLMENSAIDCGVSPNSVGVPMLYIKPTKQCLIGDQKIIDYFTKTLKINQ